MQRALAGVVLLLLAVSSGCRPKSSEDPLRRLSPIQIADRSKPATLMIVAQYEVAIDLLEWDVNAETLAADTRARIAPGASAQERTARFYETFLAQPSRYLFATERKRSLTSKITSSGSGLAITPDGYVVTNAHVVEPDQEEVKTAAVEAVGGLVKDDLAKIRAALQQGVPGAEMSPDAVERVSRALAVQYARTARFDLNRHVLAVLGYTENNGEVQVHTKECEIRKVGKKIPGKDVAILKMEGKDFPTVPLAPSLEESGLRTGSDVYIVGYPGAVAIERDFSFASRLESSMTGGHVSGIKSMTDGWKVIQTDAAINPGNSGGPVFDSLGQVVGLATFTLGGGEGQPQTQGLNFVVSVDLVQDFLRELNVKPSRSEFTATYVRALDELDAHHRERALPLLQRLQAGHPEVSALRGFTSQLTPGRSVTPSQPAAIAAAPPPQPPPEKPPRKGVHPMAILGVMAAGMALIVIIIVLANRN